MIFKNLDVIEKLSTPILPLNSYLTKTNEMPATAGLYAFWWINTIPAGQLYRKSKLKGKKQGDDHVYHDVHWNWNLDQPHICLYVGKATSLTKRVDQHLMRPVSSADWYSKNYTRYKNKERIPFTPNHSSDLLIKRSTSCQFRAGLEHLYKHITLPLESKLNNIGFSFIEQPDPIERFYLEDLAIGLYRPWFNVDSER